jgi:hypothetical protein
MITKSTSHLENLIKEGYELNFGNCISQGFSIINKNIGGFIGYTLIYLLTTMLLGVIPFFGSIIDLIITTPLTAGFYIVASKIKNGENHEFSDFFKGFDFFGPLIGTSLFLTLIFFLTLIAMAGFVYLLTDVDMLISSAAEFSVSFIFVVLLLMLPFIYLIVAYNWSSMLVVFYGYSAWRAMETSRKMITKKWFSVFLYFFIISLILMAGLFAFGLGILYTIPFFMCANYVAFSEITKGEVVDDVIDHLVE